MVSMPLTLASDTQHPLTVYVSVDIKNETTRSLLLSYIKRELRSLGDVDIVSQDRE